MSTKFSRMVCAVFISTIALAQTSIAEQLLAPPTFSYGGNPAVAIDFRKVDLALSLDPAGKSIGRAVVEFDALDSGFPIFDLVPNLRSFKLNGLVLATSDVPVIDSPDGSTRFRLVKSAVIAGSANTMEMEFDINYGDISGGRARIAFLMSDLATSGREFWEQYGPANYEFDQFFMNLTMEVKNAQMDHEVFTNGELTEVAKNSWSIAFPGYFDTSSFFLHITEKGRFKVERGVFDGIGGQTPVLVYSNSLTTSAQALSNTLKVMQELEETYGPFAHDRVVLYITDSGGGMEHCGAAVTSLWALEHEITHSWFARGVMPANGNAGWIDEAIASWRDDDYVRASSAPNRSPVNLGGFSPYRRHTTMEAYSLGKKLIGELDYLLRDIQGPKNNGMRFVLGQFFEKFARKTIGVGDFKDFLTEISGQNLDELFSRYVYGKALKFEQPQLPIQPQFSRTTSRHPRPFTAEERKRLN